TRSSARPSITSTTAKRRRRRCRNWPSRPRALKVKAMDPGIDIGLDRLLAATGGTRVAGGAERFSSVVIDGRAPAAGALFFAVKGERFDGVEFVGQAIAAGARGVVVPRGRGASLPVATGVTVVEVDDVVQALGRL